METVADLSGGNPLSLMTQSWKAVLVWMAGKGILNPVIRAVLPMERGSRKAIIGLLREGTEFWKVVVKIG